MHKERQKAKLIGGDKNMEAKIGIGLDNIIFGMNQEETKTILGEPNKISETEKDSGVVYTFNQQMIKLKFDKDNDMKLYSIEVHNPNIKMFNRRIINKTKEEIKSLLMSIGYSDIEYNEYDFFETLFCEEIWTTFEFEFDRLKSVEFSPLYKDDNEIIWPTRS